MCHPVEMPTLSSPPRMVADAAAGAPGDSGTPPDSPGSTAGWRRCAATVGRSADAQTAASEPPFSPFRMTGNS